jgi:hypothetical protein
MTMHVMSHGHSQSSSAEPQPRVLKKMIYFILFIFVFVLQMIACWTFTQLWLLNTRLCEQIQDAFGRVPSNLQMGVKGWVYKKGDWKNPSFQKRYFVLSFDKLKG